MVSSSSRPRAFVLGRVAAPLMPASAVVHVLLLDAASLGSILMALMAAACLPCAWQLWRNATARAWRFVAAMEGTMLVLHLQMIDGGRSAVDAYHAMPGMEHDSSVTALMGL